MSDYKKTMMKKNRNKNRKKVVNRTVTRTAKIWEEIEQRIIEDESICKGTLGPDGLLARYDQLVSKCTTAGKWTTTDKFLRFITASMAMKGFNQSREFTKVHEWITRGLNDAYQGTQVEVLNHETINEFFNDTNIRNSQYFEVVMISWLGDLYYYCAEQTAIDSVGEYYLPLALAFCTDRPLQKCDGSLAFLLSRLMTWTVQVNNVMAKDVTSKAEMLATHTTVPTVARYTLAYTLSTRSGRLSGQTSAYWTNYVLMNFADLPQPIELMHLLLVSWDGEHGKDSEAILEQIQRQRVRMVSASKSPLSLRVNEDGASEFIKPLLTTALRKGNFSFLHKLISIWYGIDAHSLLIPERILWQAPLHDEGCSYLLSDSLLTIESDCQPLLIELTEASNRFTGISVSVKGEKSEKLYVPERIGVPSPHDAVKFETALIATYLRPKYKDWLLPLHDSIDCQVMVPSKSHPIQALQLKVLGTTWPFTASFMRPLHDAKIQKVAIWSPGGMMAQDFELTTALEIFKRNQIDVEVFRDDACQNTQFVEMYANDSYDLIWIISHGEYDHFSPKEAKLHISNDSPAVGMAELLTIQPCRTTRRLLFLNVCDGATHPGEGILPRIGFAPSLAAPWQAVISHTWPVANIPAAALGAILAHNLATETPFFDSYKKTISTLISSSSDEDNIADQIDLAAGQSTELSTRLRNGSHNLSSFEHYASASFFE